MSKLLDDKDYFRKQLPIIKYFRSYFNFEVACRLYLISFPINPFFVYNGYEVNISSCSKLKGVLDVS